MYDRIVIPVDGSDEAKRAAERSMQLAERFDASVDILHVVPQSALRLTKSSTEKEKLRERGERILTEIEEIAAERSLSITTELREGQPTVQISECAVEQDATLVVIGRQGMTGLGKRLLGGVTENVLHRCEVPILVVPDTEMDPDYSRVLIPTDGSQNAESAAPHGIAVAEAFESTLHVLNVVDLQAAGGMFNAGGLEKEFVDRLRERGKEAADRVVEQINERAPALDTETAVRTTSYEGVAAGIREYVTDNEIDIVVIGSHGRSNLKRQFLGSVASGVLRTVDVPVLVVRRADHRGEESG